MNSEYGRDALTRIEDCVRADTKLRDGMHQDGKRFWAEFCAKHGLDGSAGAPVYLFNRLHGTTGHAHDLFIVFRGATLVVRYVLHCDRTIAVSGTDLESQATADGWIGNEVIVFDRMKLPVVARSPVVDAACAIERAFIDALAPLGDYVDALRLLCVEAYAKRYGLRMK